MAQPTNGTPPAAAPAALQWAFRSQTALGVRSGAPSYSTVDVAGLEGKDEGALRRTARVFQYSPDGSVLAAAFDDALWLLHTGGSVSPSASSQPAASSSAHVDSQAASHRSLAVEKVVDVAFSPRGNFLSTWQRPYKLADGVTGARNLTVWNTRTGEAVGSFERRAQDGCHFQFTHNEAYALRLVSSELQVFDAKDMAGKGVIGRLRLEGMTSYEVGPGEKASVAVFCAEKKGAPASVRIYPLASLLASQDGNAAPIAQKTFYKADKIQIKWNVAGTALLFLTSTEHDKTGKSYYGETNLFMMSTRGDFDCRVGLDKEGPVHDFEWNPNGREFLVIYGYMPAKTTLFSYKVNVIAELGSSGRNFASFHPQGRLFVLGGFGNLRGEVDVWDREKLGGSAGSDAAANAAAKLATFDASNSSVCQWSPDGRFILTATLSPRLRVENGVKIWHCSGKLVHVEEINELYQAAWRPLLPADAMAAHPFPKAMPEAPSPSPTAAALLEAQAAKAASKPAGAYRPPGARGQPISDIFARRFEASASGSSSPNGSGASTPVPGAYVPPGAARRGGGRSSVPGAAPPPGSAQAAGAGGQAKKGKKGAAAKGGAAANGTANGSAPAPAPIVASGPADIGGSAADGSASGLGAAAGAIDKKLRNLNKKLKAIQELKDKRDRGEKLEQTQMQKIESEGELRRELASLE